MTTQLIPAPRMIPVIAGYTLRACFPTKRRLGLLLPAGGAILFGLLAHRVDGYTAGERLASVEGGLFGVILPLACLTIGDAVLGSETRSGTLHFTWLSPVSFASIVAGRWLAGFAVALAAVAVPFALAAVVAGAPAGAPDMALAAAAGSAAYIAVFVMLGVLARRAVVWSLAFVVLGERLLGGALTGIAQWSPGWEARAVYARLGPDASDLIRDGLPDGTAAIVRLIIITLITLLVAAWRLGHIKLSGPSAD